jgi:hypothetical protein
MFARGMIGVLAVSAAGGCDQHVEALDRSPKREDARRSQLDLDVGAIVAGMMRAGGTEAVASLPK